MNQIDFSEIDRRIRVSVMETIYVNPNMRNHYLPMAVNTVNQNIPQVPKIHEDAHLEQLKQHGYIVIQDFLAPEEIDRLKSKALASEGYNTHVPVYSDGILRKYTPDYEFNTLSYPPNLFINDEIILSKITHPYLISLAQGYLGCFPTMYSLNCWWHKYTASKYMTQKTHRDHDDFRFLAFFIYLSDIDESNGPHVFYPRTQDGSEMKEEVVITGKAGTAIMADTFAYHRGQPLTRGERLLVWWRYGVYVNEIYFNNKDYLYQVPKEEIFKHIEKNFNNEYLLRAFLK